MCDAAHFPLNAVIEVERNFTLDGMFFSRARIIRRRFTIGMINENEPLNDDTVEMEPSEINASASSSSPTTSSPSPSLLNIDRRDKSFKKRRQSTKD